jgi:hypothetical protein
MSHCRKIKNNTHVSFASSIVAEVASYFVMAVHMHTVADFVDTVVDSSGYRMEGVVVVAAAAAFVVDCCCSKIEIALIRVITPFVYCITQNLFSTAPN